MIGRRNSDCMNVCCDRQANRAEGHGQRGVRRDNYRSVGQLKELVTYVKREYDQRDNE